MIKHIKVVTLALFLNIALLTNAFADKILLIRGLDQVIFRGMDILGSELRALGHDVTVQAPMMAQENFKVYDVVIGNSQGAVVAMNRRQKTKPRLVVTIDLPYHPAWRSRTGIRHLNIHGSSLYWTRLNGAKNVFINKSHLLLSYDPGMRRVVKKEIMVW